MSQPRPKLHELLLHLATVQRGAWLWMPCILLAAFLALFGMRMAPVGTSLFTRATSARVAIGAWRGAAANSVPADRFRQALALRLTQEGAVTLADSARVADQLAAVPESRDDPTAFLRAVRALNPRHLVSGTLQPDRGSVFAAVEIWDARTQRCLRTWQVQNASPVSLGRAAADSILSYLLAP